MKVGNFICEEVSEAVSKRRRIEQRGGTREGGTLKGEMERWRGEGRGGKGQRCCVPPETKSQLRHCDVMHSTHKRVCHVFFAYKVGQNSKPQAFVHIFAKY